MSDALIKDIQDMLNEEKWTRAAITNYSKNNFIELSSYVEKAQNENCIDELKEVCDEHLSHTKNSIIGLYLSGMLALKKKTLDNSALVTLVTIFQDNRKTEVVKYLCQTIIAEDENNKFALRTLAECYRDENNEEIWKLYETIVRLDYEEAEIVKLLAEHAEENNDIQTAIDYYKKALLRYVNKGSATQVKELWSKLVSLIPEEIDFFYLVQRKVAKQISEVRSAALMQEVYVYYKDKEEWNICIDILKLMLGIDDKDSWARKEIVDCYRGKYADHSQLEDYIHISNLTQNWRNVFEAINDFEKHISFDAKNFVFHRSWGVGIIRSVKNDEIEINFGRKYGVKKMSLKMAVSALQPLARNHIWVLKATKTKEALAKMVKDDKTWALKTIIKSFDNNCDFKRIKAELVPGILTAGEWTSWSTAARKILDTNATFGINPDDITHYIVRNHAISQEEKLSDEFKAQKQFFARIDILMRFEKEADTTSELFSEMVGYFTGFLKSFTSVTEQTIASYLVIRRISTKYPNLNPNLSYTFEQLYNEIENPNALYSSLKDTKNTNLRPDFLLCIRELLPNWDEEYIRLFPTVLKQDMLTQLVNAGHTDKIETLVRDAFENYRDYREAVIFFFKESQDEDWFSNVGLTFEKEMIALIHIMDVNFREIENHTRTTENKKINRQIQTLLFKNNTLLDYCLVNDEDISKEERLERITRLYTLVNDVADLDGTIKMNMRNRILEQFPDFKFQETEEKTITSKGLIVTSKMLEIKKAELEHITKVEIPENSKEIGEAMAQGDLKENAEYKAAKEKQSQLNATGTRLQDEIDRAQIFDPSSVTVARVGFGNKVELTNTKTNATEVFTILGPWESDPDNGIISYMSPLGNSIMNAKVGETLSFEINEVTYSYKIEKIEVAKLDD
ncbi:MAG: transcription elongation factor GreA [Treponema sp. CETP13]|nr:MAG: transcription elongation factor GreA [Treponema sp. CETP13]